MGQDVWDRIKCLVNIRTYQEVFTEHVRQEVIKETNIFSKPVQNSACRRESEARVIQDHGNRDTILLTNGVGVEEQHGGSEDGSEHPVV